VTCRRHDTNDNGWATTRRLPRPQITMRPLQSARTPAWPTMQLKRGRERRLRTLSSTPITVRPLQSARTPTCATMEVLKRGRERRLRTLSSHRVTTSHLQSARIPSHTTTTMRILCLHRVGRVAQRWHSALSVPTHTGALTRVSTVVVVVVKAAGVASAAVVVVVVVVVAVAATATVVVARAVATVLVLLLLLLIVLAMSTYPIISEHTGASLFLRGHWINHLQILAQGGGEAIPTPNMRTQVETLHAYRSLRASLSRTCSILWVAMGTLCSFNCFVYLIILVRTLRSCLRLIVMYVCLPLFLLTPALCAPHHAPLPSG
jgi:hypothetical protein